MCNNYLNTKDKTKLIINNIRLHVRLNNLDVCAGALHSGK